MIRWHPDVDDRNVRRGRVDERKQALGVAGLPGDFEAALDEQPSEAFAEQQRVVGERYAHGSSALTHVPPPGGLTTVNTPSSDATRSASPRRPVPTSIAAP